MIWNEIEPKCVCGVKLFDCDCVNKKPHEFDRTRFYRCPKCFKSYHYNFKGKLLKIE